MTCTSQMCGAYVLAFTIIERQESRLSRLQMTRYLISVMYPDRLEQTSHNDAMIVKTSIFQALSASAWSPLWRRIRFAQTLVVFSTSDMSVITHNSMWTRASSCMIRSDRVSPPVATRHVFARGTTQRPVKSSATVSAQR